MKIKRYQIITALLFCYGLFMTLYFGLDLLNEGQALRFWLTLAGEAVVLTMTFFALRHRDMLRQQRKEDIEAQEKIAES